LETQLIKKGSPEDKNTITESIAKWTAISSRPFSIVYDKGFGDVLQQAINIGYTIYFIITIFYDF
jgi:hypothetical protein